MIPRETIEQLYLVERQSMNDIAQKLQCSLHKVSYWLKKYQIQTRSISDAIYQRNNPYGDPFSFREPNTLSQAALVGYGLGLYWGEGTKACKTSVRIGNSDPALLSKFILFLVQIFGIKKADLRFSLQLFTDIDEKEAMQYWLRGLRVNARQFTKTTITPSRKEGTYRHRSQTGVVTLYYHNKKLRDTLVQMIKTY
ncbi:MAG: hypothetical protein Q7S47_01380 [bacterium]|nr:hypothetical protein [bacterium]